MLSEAKHLARQAQMLSEAKHDRTVARLAFLRLIVYTTHTSVAHCIILENRHKIRKYVLENS